MQKVRSHLRKGSYCLYACGFRFYFTPLPGFFSPFPHGTGSLSVDHEYLALEDGEKDPGRGVKKNLKPYVYKLWKNYICSTAYFL